MGKMYQAARRVRHPTIATAEIAAWIEVRREHRHVRRTRRFYRRMVRRGDLAFDVGANLGTRVSVLLDIGARVVAVEPQPRCAQVLADAYGDRISLITAALGDSPGSATLHTNPDAHTVGSMEPAWIEAVRASGRFDYDWAVEVPVEVTPLDALIADHGEPRFVKIDVEGYEPHVLAGLSTPVQHLSIEFTPERADDTSRCIELLRSLGDYRFWLSLGESMKFHGPWRSGDDALVAIRAMDDSVTFGDLYCQLNPPDWRTRLSWLLLWGLPRR